MSSCTSNVGRESQTVRPFCSSMNIISNCFPVSLMNLLILSSCFGVHMSEVRLVSTVRVFTRVVCRQEQQSGLQFLYARDIYKLFNFYQ